MNELNGWWNLNRGLPFLFILFIHHLSILFRGGTKIGAISVTEVPSFFVTRFLFWRSFDVPFTNEIHIHYNFHQGKTDFRPFKITL